MGYFLDGFRSLATTLKNVLRPSHTQQFPEVIRPRPERYKASFALLHDEAGDELCIGCLACERICPSQIIQIKQAPKRESLTTGKKRGYAEEFSLDLTACIYCELCVQVCPEDAIVMTREQEIPMYAREDLVLTMPKLYENEKKKTRTWADGAKLMGMQEPPKPPAPAVPPAAPKPAAPAPAAAAPAPAAAAPAPAAAAPAPAPAAPATAPVAADPKPAEPTALPPTGSTNSGGTP